MASSQEEKTHLQDWLGEGGLPVMRGLQLADQLQAQLNNGQQANKTCFTHEIRGRLLEIVNSLNDGIQKLSFPILPPQHSSPLNKQAFQSHLKLEHSSPIIGKDQLNNIKHSPRKLKRCLPKFRFTLQGVNEGFDDYFTWRKYGRKIILGKTYPRSYYRCIHKGDLNCPALKQVQQCDGNASRSDITYIGKHTCEGICEGHHAQNDAASPLLSRLHSNSYTSLASSTQELNSRDGGGETSLRDCEIELGEGVECSGPAATTMSTLLEHEMLLPTSLEETADNYNFPQHEESHNSLSIWDFEPFPAFLDFESQL